MPPACAAALQYKACHGASSLASNTRSMQNPASRPGNAIGVERAPLSLASRDLHKRNLTGVRPRLAPPRSSPHPTLLAHILCGKTRNERCCCFPPEKVGPAETAPTRPLPEKMSGNRRGAPAEAEHGRENRSKPKLPERCSPRSCHKQARQAAQMPNNCLKVVQTLLRERTVGRKSSNSSRLAHVSDKFDRTWPESDEVRQKLGNLCELSPEIDEIRPEFDQDGPNLTKLAQIGHGLSNVVRFWPFWSKWSEA